MNKYITFAESLKDYINDDVIDYVISAYRKVFTEDIDDVSQLNEYFKGIPAPIISRDVTLKSQKGAGRQAYRITPGQGSISYDPAGHTSSQNANGGS